MHRLRKFLRLPTERQFLLCEAILLMALARIAILVVPFRRLAPWLGCRVDNLIGTRSVTPPKGSDAENSGAASIQREIARAILHADRVTPWETKCFVQAITARLMLATRGLGGFLCLGVMKDEQNDVKAHAWLVSGGFPVTGGEGQRDYTVVSVFAFGCLWSFVLPVRNPAVTIQEISS